MDLIRNFATFLKVVQTTRGQTLTEFSEELEVARSHLHQIQQQKANPRIDTVQHIANKLGTEPAVMLSFSYTEAQVKALEFFLNLTEIMSSLDPEKTKEAVRLLQEFLQLWGSDDDKN